MQAYLDNSATTKCAPQVVDVCVKVMQEDYGNPSSKHMKGVEAENYIKDAKETIAKTLKCQDKEILFTSGGTESNNMAIIGTAMANKRKGNHVIVSSVEHSSVKEPFNFLEEQGFKVTYLKVDSKGIVDIEELKNALDDAGIYTQDEFETFTIEKYKAIANIDNDKSTFRTRMYNCLNEPATRWLDAYKTQQNAYIVWNSYKEKAQSNKDKDKVQQADVKLAEIQEELDKLAEFKAKLKKFCSAYSYISQIVD